MYIYTYIYIYIRIYIYTCIHVYEGTRGGDEGVRGGYVERSGTGGTAAPSNNRRLEDGAGAGAD